MANNGNFTVFTNSSGAAAGSLAYVQDVFQDVSLGPTSNAGLTNTFLRNPLAANFSDDDSARVGAKTLYIKDLVLVADRTKWINSRPTYQIIWHENFPQVVGYISGNPSTRAKADYLSGVGQTQPIVTLLDSGDCFGVTGVVRRVSFLVNDNTAATATGTVITDGVSGSTIDYSSMGATADTNGYARFSAFAHAAANETKDLHDIRLQANQASTLQAIGVIVYFENSGYTIDQNPGTTYVNKSKVTSTVGTTLALPVFGSSLGGKAILYKTASSGYTLAATSAQTVTSIGQGLSGTNLLSVSTGHGASFPIGSALVVNFGASAYVGSVLSVSTDTLTVAPTIGFGISQAVYRSWFAGQSTAINASLMQLAYSLDFSKLPSWGGFTSPMFDPRGRYGFWGTNLGVTLTDNIQAACFTTNAGFMQVEGNFCAADIETVGSGTFHATIGVNGLPGFGVNAGQTGILRRPIFSEAGPGWNSVNINCGTSMGTVAISRINLYQRARNIGVTTGLIAEIESNQSYVDRGAANATLTALGIKQRLYADRLYLKGAWDQGWTSTVTGGKYFYGATTNCIMQCQYWGKNYAIHGTPNGGTLTLDGAGVAATFGFMQSVATEGFHTILYTLNSSTAVISAIDIAGPQGEIKNIQNVIGAVVSPPTPIPIVTPWAQENGVNTYSNLGTITSEMTFSRRVGDTYHCRVFLSVGTLAASPFSINLNAKYVIDRTKYGNGNITQKYQVGTLINTASAGTGIYAGGLGMVLFINGQVWNQIFAASNTSGQQFALINGNGFNTSSNLMFEFSVPIEGW